MLHQMTGSFIGRKDCWIFIKLWQGHQGSTKVLFVFLEFGVLSVNKILMDFKGRSFLSLKNGYFALFIFLFWQGNDDLMRITLMFALNFSCTNVLGVSSTIENLSFFFFSIQGVIFSAWFISINSSVRTKTHNWSNLHFLITFLDIFFLWLFFSFGSLENKNFKGVIFSFIFWTHNSFLHLFIINRWFSKRNLFISMILFDLKELLWKTRWILDLNFDMLLWESWVFSPCKFIVL